MLLRRPISWIRRASKPVHRQASSVATASSSPPSFLITAGIVYTVHKGGLKLVPEGGDFQRVRAWTVPAYVLTLAGVAWFRSVRWRFLLRSIAEVPKKRLFSVSSIGFAAILLLPFRIGEFVRPYMIRTPPGQVPGAGSRPGAGRSRSPPRRAPWWPSGSSTASTSASCWRWRCSSCPRSTRSPTGRRPPGHRGPCADERVRDVRPLHDRLHHHRGLLLRPVVGPPRDPRRRRKGLDQARENACGNGRELRGRIARFQSRSRRIRVPRRDHPLLGPQCRRYVAPRVGFRRGARRRLRPVLRRSLRLDGDAGLRHPHSRPAGHARGVPGRHLRRDDDVLSRRAS